jgi:shikimate kinase
MSKENRDIISKFGVSILLKVDPEILWERVRRKSNRPLLKTTNPKKELFKILNERKVSYNLADFNVESGKKNTTQQTSQKVIDTLKNRPDVLNPLGN